MPEKSWFSLRTIRILMLASAAGLMLGGAAAGSEGDSEPPPLSTAEMDGLVDAYFDRLAAVFRAGSTEEEIERFLELMHADVRYEHPRFGADFDLDAWRSAFRRNLERGSYQASAERSIRVVQRIHGRDAVAAEYEYVEPGADDADEESRRFLILFQFTGGKIARATEYW